MIRISGIRQKYLVCFLLKLKDRHIMSRRVLPVYGGICTGNQHNGTFRLADILPELMICFLLIMVMRGPKKLGGELSHKMMAPVLLVR